MQDLIKTCSKILNVEHKMHRINLLEFGHVQFLSPRFWSSSSDRYSKHDRTSPGCNK